MATAVCLQHDRRSCARPVFFVGHRAAEDAEALHADVVPGGTRFVNQRSRLVSVWGRCWRRHFQKNSLISARWCRRRCTRRTCRKIATTVEPTNGWPAESVSLTLTLAFSPGL